MEQMPHHREGIQNDLDKAYDEGQRDNEAIKEAEAKIGEIKGGESREAVDASLEKMDSIFRVDARIEGGFVDLKVDEKTAEAVMDWKTAKAAYLATGGKVIDFRFDRLPNIESVCSPLKNKELHLVFLKADETTPSAVSMIEEQKAIAAETPNSIYRGHPEGTFEPFDMVPNLKEKGYRPLTFSEFAAFAILRPDLNKDEGSGITNLRYEDARLSRSDKGDEHETGSESLAIWNDKSQSQFYLRNAGLSQFGEETFIFVKE